MEALAEKTVSASNPDYKRTMVILCFCGLWTQQYWGLVAFSIDAMIQYDGFQLSTLGLLLPMLSIASIPAQIVVDKIAPKVSAKLLLVTGMTTLSGGATLIWAVPHIGGLFAGFVICGFAWAIVNTMPYVQLGLLVPKKDVAFWYAAHETCKGMISPAMGRGIALGCSTLISSRWGWRVPWMIVSAGAVTGGVLILLFARPQRPALPKQQEQQTGSWVARERAIWCHPVAFLLMPAIAFASFGFDGFAIWGVKIALDRFQVTATNTTDGGDLTAAAVSLPMGIATGISYPAAVVGTSALIRWASGRFERAQKYSAIFFVAAAAAAAGTALSYNLYAFVVCFAVYCSLGYHSLLYYKALPPLLVLPPLEQLAMISRANLLWTVFGEIAGVYVTGLLMDGTTGIGVDGTLWTLTGSVAAAATLWCVPSFWAWTKSGPVPQLIALRDANERDRARAAWLRLRHVWAAATGRTDGPATSDDDVAADKGLLWPRWRWFPVLMAASLDHYAPAHCREVLCGIIEAAEEQAEMAAEQRNSGNHQPAGKTTIKI